MNKALLEALTHFVGSPDGVATQTSDCSPLRTPPAATTAVSSDQPESVTHQLARQGYTRTHRFLVLPTSREPRWLLPLGDARRIRKGFQIYAPYGPMARMLKNLLAGVLRAGWKGWQSNRVLVASKGSLPLEDLIREVTGECQPIFALSLGAPGRLRKLTVQVMRPDGKLLGYMKLPLTDAASERVRHEADVLERLWSFPALRPHVPKVLYAGERENGYILFQSAGPPRPGEVEFGPSHEQFLQILRSIKRTEKPGHALVEETGTCWRRAAPRLGTRWRELGTETLQKARQELTGLILPCGIMHGDFAPWNTRTEDGRLFVFDWESADWELPIRWDVFHFHLQVAFLLNRNGKNSLPSRQAPGERASFWLYLLRSICRLLDEDVPGHLGIAYRQRILLRELAQS